MKKENGFKAREMALKIIQASREKAYLKMIDFVSKHLKFKAKKNRKVNQNQKAEHYKKNQNKKKQTIIS
jgi:hypothetical protein